jgi:hypothetical protein
MQLQPVRLPKIDFFGKSVASGLTRVTRGVTVADGETANFSTPEINFAGPYGLASARRSTQSAAHAP